MHWRLTLAVRRFSPAAPATLADVSNELIPLEPPMAQRSSVWMCGF